MKKFFVLVLAVLALLALLALTVVGCRGKGKTAAKQEESIMDQLIAAKAEVKLKETEAKLKDEQILNLNNQVQAAATPATLQGAITKMEGKMKELIDEIRANDQDLKAKKDQIDRRVVELTKKEGELEAREKKVKEDEARVDKKKEELSRMIEEEEKKKEKKRDVSLLEARKHYQGEIAKRIKEQEALGIGKFPELTFGGRPKSGGMNYAEKAARNKTLEKEILDLQERQVKTEKSIEDRCEAEKSRLRNMG